MAANGSVMLPPPTMAFALQGPTICHFCQRKCIIWTCVCVWKYLLRLTNFMYYNSEDVINCLRLSFCVGYVWLAFTVDWVSVGWYFWKMFYSRFNYYDIWWKMSLCLVCFKLQYFYLMFLFNFNRIHWIFIPIKIVSKVQIFMKVSWLNCLKYIS